MAITRNLLTGAPTAPAALAKVKSPAFWLWQREATSLKASLRPLKMNKTRIEGGPEPLEIESFRNLTAVTTLEACKATLIAPLKAKIGQPVS